MGRRWCKNDPALKIDGEVVHLTLFASTDDDRFATGLVSIEIYGAVDADVSQANIFGQKATVITRPAISESDDRGFDANIMVPGPPDIEIRATLTPAGNHYFPVLFAFGFTNEVIWFN